VLGHRIGRLGIEGDEARAEIAGAEEHGAEAAVELAVVDIDQRAEILARAEQKLDPRCGVVVPFELARGPTGKGVADPVIAVLRL